MTTPNGPILFNTEEGSDTQASGLGPPVARYGTGASTTGSSAVVTGIDTTNVLPGDLLWVQSSSGRQFSIIYTVDSSTQVTCDDVFANTESGRTWAIGGKRATIQGSSALFVDDIGYVLIELETDQDLTQAIALSAPVTVRSNEAGVKRTINQQSDSTPIFEFSLSNRIVFRDIKFLNTSSIKERCFKKIANNSVIRLEDCIVGETGSGFSYALSVSNYNTYICTRTVFRGCTFGFYGTYNNTGTPAVFKECWFDNCDYGAWASHLQPVIAENCVFSNCSQIALQNTLAFSAFYRREIKGCIFYNNNIGIATGSSYFPGLSNQHIYYVDDCIFLNNTTAISSYGQFNFSFNRTGFVGNTANKINVVDWEDINPLNLSTDPFVDAANGNFNINTSNAGGRTLRATNYTIGD